MFMLVIPSLYLPKSFSMLQFRCQKQKKKKKVARTVGAGVLVLDGSNRFRIQKKDGRCDGLSDHRSKVLRGEEYI
ncbi:hypothetical protein L6452_01001 [Arctium lappa]|uniref:Uncharacterized protein n=1 Tax=Arctium lappa TaxID=4217 RepID=A0ACB9FGW8_ARCLA|nr:hypothetical protein L6452_01001 [Arctium lappa]